VGRVVVPDSDWAGCRHDYYDYYDDYDDYDDDGGCGTRGCGGGV
jgi:hypothetical protein